MNTAIKSYVAIMEPVLISGKVVMDAGRFPQIRLNQVAPLPLFSIPSQGLKVAWKLTNDGTYEVAVKVPVGFSVTVDADWSGTVKAKYWEYQGREGVSLYLQV